MPVLKTKEEYTQMKKLMMIAAAMTIAGSAFAACQDGPTNTVGYCALVYKVKMNLKTTKAKTLSGYYDKSDCEDVDAVCYREKGSIALNGYAYACECSCEGFMSAAVTLWDKKKVYYTYEDTLGWSVLNIFGKNSKKVEGSWTLTSDPLYFLVGSGFGSFDPKSYLIKNISGNVAGFGAPPVCIEDCEDESAAAYDCDDVFEDMVSELPTVYFGTWSYRYSKSDSNKLADDSTSIYDKFPL